MTNPFIKIVNAETGEEIERAMNAAEFKQYELEQANHKVATDEREAQAVAKQAVLDRLGITAEEAALLLG
jgi:hypothetical protein